MEQTLGKRIMACRKQLGLTQDQLAEQLGVTAQAVSKWENDQSCPDINMLPKLAEIFGTTTDALLGIEPKQKVHEAEIVDSDERDKNENEGIHINKGNFEFKYDSGRKSSLGVAAWVLLSGGLLLVSNLLHWNVSLWDILWPAGLLIFGLWGLWPHFSFFRLGCSFFGAYFLLSNLNFPPFQFGKELLLPILLVLFGLSLLVDAMRKSKKPHVHIHYGNKNSKSKRAHMIEGESFACSASFCEDRQYISMPRLSDGHASISFGEMIVDLGGVEEVAEDCSIDLSCSFGEMVLLVPRRYRVKSECSNFFSSVAVSGEPDPVPVGSIHVESSVIFGEISIRYV